MKRNFKFDIPSRFVFYFLAIIGVVLLFISYTTGFSGGPIRTVAEYVFVPMQKGLDIVGERISVNARDASTRQELLDENEKLKSELEDLKNQLANTRTRESELENLRALFELASEYENYDTTGAYVIGRSGSNWFDTFTIDKGAADGIKEDMNVIAGGGLVGIVISVGEHYSTVRSIIDDTNNVSAMTIGSEDNCIVTGNLLSMTESNMISFGGLEDSKGKLKVGDPLITSNISDKYVPGILIGYIGDIKEDANGLTKSGTIAPVADFKHLSSVLVITKTKESGQK